MTKNKKIDSIILDVDGTLWDTTDICAAAWNKAIAEHSHTTTRLTGDMLKKLFGKTMQVIFEAVFPDLSEQERTKLSDLCCIYEHDALCSENPIVFPDVVDTIKALSTKYPLFIVSNCQKGYIEQFIEKTSLAPYITDFLCYGDTNASKGQTMKQLIERNHLNHPIYVGDTQGDADACTEANVPFIYAAYGFGQTTWFDKQITAFSELLAL